MLCLVDAQSDRGSTSEEKWISDDNDHFDDGVFVTTRSGRVAECMVHTKCSCVYGEETKNLTWGMKFFYSICMAYETYDAWDDGV